MSIKSKINSQQLKIMEDVGFTLENIEKSDGIDYAVWGLQTTGPSATYIKFRVNVLWKMTYKCIFERVYSEGIRHAENNIYNHIHRALRII